LLVKTFIRVILHFLCCTRIGKTILHYFHHLCLSATVTHAVFALGQIRGSTLHFSHFTYDERRPGPFELRLIFGFEQSSFDYGKNRV